jgi:colicin import membrane protein
MEASAFHPGSELLMEQRWTKMFVISIVLHLALCSLVLFVPEPSFYHKAPSVVYEVDLVEMPAGKMSGPAIGAAGKRAPAKALSAPPKATPAKRLSPPKPEAKPVVIAKKEIQTKPQPLKSVPEPAVTKRLDKPSEIIPKKVEENKKQTEQNDQELINKALSKVAAKVRSSADEKSPPAPGQSPGTGKATARGAGGTGGTGGAGGGAAGGQGSGNRIALGLYRAEVMAKVTNNWSYPAALNGPKNKNDCEAIVVVTASSDGTISDVELKHSSGNPIFDESVLKAIKRSEPLPRLPEGYTQQSEEIEFTFNLSEMENQ